MKDLVQTIGDYGDVAVQLRKLKASTIQSHSTILTLDSIVVAAQEINSLSGEDSVKKKINLMV